MDDPIPFISRVLRTTLAGMQHRSVLIPSTLGTVGGALAFRALHVERQFWNMSASDMLGAVLVLCVQWWFSLTATATALSVIRAGFGPRRIVWVAPTTAFEAGFVTLVLLFPTLGALFLLVIPGILLALRWSQVVYLLLDGHAEWFGAATASEDLTSGQRLLVFYIWAVAGLVLSIADWIMRTLGEILVALGAPGAVSTGADLTLLVAANAFTAVILAALYLELQLDMDEVWIPTTPDLEPTARS
jgi:hypothetical protein